MAVQLEMERTPEMVEIVLTALSCLVRSDNFPGKRSYIYALDGIKQLVRWNDPSNPELSKKFTDAAQFKRNKVKVAGLLADLVTNDDGIFNDGFYVRD